MDTLPLADIKKRLSEVVDRVEDHQERVVLTRRGRPAAVLISPDDLAALEETVEILSQPWAVDEIKAAEEDLARGDFVTADELRQRYLQR